MDVLRWIADGCQEGVMEGHTYKTTAMALKGRGLVTISKRGGSWRAAVTPSGLRYLERGPEPTEGTATHSRATRPPNRPPGSPAGRRASGPKPASTGRKPRPPSPTDRLIADLLVNGEIEVAQPERAKVLSQVHAAQRFNKVPLGKRVVVDGYRWSSRFVVRLEDAPWMTATLEPVPVPTRLNRPHPAVESLRSGPGPTGIDRSAVHRVLLLVQAIAVEAERRGYRVLVPREADRWSGQRPAGGDHVQVTVNGHTVGLRFRQASVRRPHVPTPSEEARALRDSWYRVPKYDVSLTERLSVEVSGRFEHRQSRWSDSPAGRLEDSLAEILQELELRSEAAERERRAQLAEAEERRGRWERAMHRATEAYTEHHRAEVLMGQLEAWLRIGHLRDYVAAMRQAIDSQIDPERAAEASEWLAWAEGWMATNDPIPASLRMPEIPKPSPDDLRPYLNGWSPHGP